MVGTAQADSLAIFIRKVGYSVGVESLLSRARDFGRAYASVASFRESDWTNLVEGSWHLKSGNVADVFSALDIARIYNREVFPGTIGEALGILYKLDPSRDWELGIRLLVASAIVRSDGDVFLNSLASEFRPVETSTALLKMIQAKREALFEVFATPRDRERIARVVSIDRQRTNRGSATGGALSSLVRSQPLEAKSQGLGLPQTIDVFDVDAPSADYLRKVTVSRRGWAESLGLYARGALTIEGNQFLVELSSRGFAGRDGSYVVWPTCFELEANLYKPDSFSNLNIQSSWDFQVAIFRAMGGKCGFASLHLPRVAGRIREIYDAYRELSQHRNMIRNEVSSHVIGSVMLSEALTREEMPPNLDGVWREDLTPYGITVRPSKTIEKAITVRP
jgi:hypothetical protein